MEKKKTYKDFGNVTLGESEDFTPNELWEEQGLICEWEHCIENMALVTVLWSRYKCPVFGHKCPGKKEQIVKCKNIATELWHKLDGRFK